MRSITIMKLIRNKNGKNEKQESFEGASKENRGWQQKIWRVISIAYRKSFGEKYFINIK